MGRWTPDDHGCIYDEAGCFARLTPNKAERLATRHNADIDALTAERDDAIDEKLFWAYKYAYEMEKSDSHCDQWQRCFRLAFGLKNKYYSKLRTVTAERDNVEAELAAANDTLDRLREVVPEAITTAKIKALMEQLRRCQVMNGGFVQLPIVLSSEITAAIEILLARQAEAHKRELCLHAAGCETNELLDTLRAKILEVVDNFDPTWPEDGLRKIRAILNPENET